jgi:hypothetical protein
MNVWMRNKCSMVEFRLTLLLLLVSRMQSCLVEDADAICRW